jgi:O-antigen/teichoic acid export membrane protein
VTNGVVLVLNVATGVVAGRCLGPGGRGVLAAIMVWPQFLGYAFAFALPSAVLYHARSDPDAKRSITGAALALSLAGGALSCAVGVLAMPWLLQGSDAATLRVARELMVFAPFATVAATLTAVVQLEGEFRLFNRIRYLPPVATLAGLLVLWAAHLMTPLTAALAYFLPGVPPFLWVAYWAGRHIRPSFRIPLRDFRRLLSYSGRAYGGEAAATLLSQTDKLVLVNVLSAADYGVYVVAFSLSRVITTIGAAIVPVLLPKSAGKSPATVTAMTGRALSIATPLLLVGAAVPMLFGQSLLQLLYGRGFGVGHLALALLAAEAVVATVAYVMTQPYLALNRPGLITVIQLVSLPMLAVSLFALVPAFGIAGAATALLVSTTCRAGWSILGYRRTLGVAPPALWPTIHESREFLRKLRAAS